MHPITIIVLSVLCLCILTGCVFFFLCRRHRAALSRTVRSRFGQIPSSPKTPGTDAHTLYCIFKEHFPEFEYIDEDTWNDLELDALFSRLCVCESEVGELCLYTALHTLGNDTLSKSRAKLKLLFQRDPALRTEVMTQLALLGKTQGLLRVFSDLSEEVHHTALYRMSSLLWFLSLPCLFLGPWAVLFLLTSVFNTALFYMKKDTLLLRLQTLSSAGCLLRTAKALAKELCPSAPAFSRLLMQTVQPLKPVLSYALGTAGSAFSELLGALTLVPLLRYSRAAHALREHSEAFLRLIGLVGELELANACLSFSASLPLSCEAEFCESLTVQASELYHPLLTEPVTNSIDIASPILFTGANASGKSTFLKAVGINVILAQTLGVCSAKRFCLPRVYLMSSMAVRDHLSANESCFTAELHRIHAMLHTAEEKPCLFLIDELLKGTNTIDRIAASCAVLHYFAKQPCLLLASTHDIELVQLLGSLFDYKYFSEQVNHTGVFFDYRLHSGVCRTRSALDLLRQLDFPSDITQKACTTAELLEHTLSSP